ncbi:hypothetical protein O3G_MSEX015120 [Manduca sexta]|uniref:Uncharacterized protein n=1 Tax=Manduca sexta TaxID=7130 RepID=A0A921ZXR9_MANSE|nr:hypothetical protein O3G_MSEX015120 [Manduca sexta]
MLNYIYKSDLTNVFLLSGTANSEGESSSAQAIKEKAMRMPVKGIAHLTAANDVTPQSSRKRKNTLRKRKGNAKVRARKKKRRNDIDLDSTDSDEVLLSDSDESEPETAVNENVCEIEFIDQYAGKDNDTIPMLGNDKGLPILIATGDTNTEDVVDNEEKTEVASKDGNSHEANTSPESSGTPNLVSDEDKVMSEVFKKPSQQIGKKDKRDLKRPFIKTKFQRMGMLSLANFVENKNKKK